MRIPTFLYAFGCSGSLAGAGLSGEYLSRNLPEGHASVSSVFVVIGFITMATYFAFISIARLVKEKSV